MSLKAKRNILIIASVIVQVLPLIIAFALNWDKYVATQGEKTAISMSVSLSAGGLLCAIMIGLSLVDKLPKPNGIMFPLIIYIIICLLEPLIIDAKLIVGMFLLGKVLDFGLFHFPIEKLKKQIDRYENGKETTRQISEALKITYGKGENK